ncbi:EAL domain-containing protein [Eubacterium oxidoreducens]|uniref:PAS domain S-box-containing protein/diguanylate cyclase (GGDEF) domain-containing protein n=1 Tax=Eubacterium oxidoreducens TaxID=1732 RepID=A0A1G6ADV2_EUBOX|nr:EAL domain-containing protein [Eubacterium oxidoreducens]SDB06490.1 PAS domain S-box-containing protein/diguanylate cyclase (GGDEF) domain-containing protein [Eubacterium oxidoreducens]
MKNMEYDSLTGLPNMSSFLELSDNGMNKIVDAGSVPAMLSFNLNGLRMFNRKYGIEEGQKLLVSFGKILEKYFTKHCCSRFGEDHFYAYAQKNGIEFKLYQIFDDMRNLNDGRSLPVRVGIYIPSGFSDPLTAVMACDRARTACDMDRKTYESKFVYFTKQMELDAKERDYILNNIDKAIKNGYIKAYYQPKIRALDGKLCGAEVLARWDDPVYGFMAPASFIPILEESNLTYKLDRYILERLSSDLKKARQRGDTIVPVSVNLSRTDFKMTDPVQVMKRIVAESKVPRKFFRVEITESTVMQDPVGMKEYVDKFQEEGFAVDMDDFGSAYSSLAMLREFTFDSIKIDMGFLRNFNNRSKRILQSIVTMSKSLGMHTVAEGVDDEEQYNFLKSIGCEMIQGYYFGEPAPFEKFNEEVKKHGIIPEKELEWSFYNDIGLEDVITDEAMSLQLFDGQRFSLVYFNSEYERLIGEQGFTVQDVLERTVNTKEKAVSRAYHDIVFRAMQYGREEGMAFTMGMKSYYIRVKMLASYEHGCMFKIILEDVTLKKQIEASLESHSNRALRVEKDENEIWHSFVENIDIKIFWKDDKRRFLGASKAFLEYYGIASLSEIVGKTDEDIGWNSEEEKYKADEYRVLNGETIHRSIGETIAKGALHKIQATKCPIEKAGKVVGLIGYFNDIEESDNETCRKNSDRSLETHHKGFRMDDSSLLTYDMMAELSKDIPVGYSILRAVMDQGSIVDLEYVYANERFCNAFGEEQQHIIGRRFSEVYGEGYERWMERARVVLLENQQIRKNEYVERLGHWVNFVIAPTRIPGYCLSINVYTDTRSNEEELLKKNATKDDVVIRIAKMMNVEVDYASLINQVLKELSRVVEAERIQIFEVHEGSIRNFYEWHAPGEKSLKYLTTDMPEKERVAWRSFLVQAGIIDIKNVESLKYSVPVIYERLKKMGVYNLYAAPFYNGSELVGFMDVVNYNQNSTVDTIGLIDSVAPFIANKILNYQLVEQLEHLSHNDVLTGVYNRNKYLANCKSYERMHISLGVIFTDLNGLKERNDRYGHKQGDIFLIDVANLLCDLFKVERVYRVGGDEFVVLLPGISKGDFEKERKRLEKALEESSHISLSPGFAWTEDTTYIKETINKADREMYAYKRNYYKTHERRKER